MFNTVIINKDNLINNIKQVKNKNPNSKICAMVKANAYGVGLNSIVNILSDYVDYFGVACFFEAEQVKEQTTKPILIVGPIEKGNVNDQYIYSVNSLDDVLYLLSLNKAIRIHIKINSGMNRYGFSSVKELKKSLLFIKQSKLILEGVFTHFATADNFIKQQYKTFLKFADLIKKEFPHVILHADNSIVSEIQNHHLDMVRIGFGLYNNISSIRTKIVQINVVKKNDLVGYDYRFVATKKMKVAILPVGYADGFELKYLGMEIFCGSTKCKILNICMDCLMLDISKTKLKKGDEIYLLNNVNNLSLFAEYAKTSTYEVLTSFSKIRANTIILD